MTSAKVWVVELVIGIAVVALLTMTMWPWQRGPIPFALALAGGWIVSHVLGDWLARRAISWRQAIGQGLACALVAWALLRWLHK